MTSKTKFDSNDPNVQSLLSLFRAINLSSTKANETIRNPKSASSLKDLIDRNNLTITNLKEKQSNLILQVALQGSKLDTTQQDYIVQYITADKLKSSDQTSGAYCNSHLYLSFLLDLLLQWPSHFWKVIHYLSMRANLKSNAVLV